MPFVNSHLQRPHDCRLLCVLPSVKSAHLLGIKAPKGCIPVHRAPKHKHALFRWGVAASHEWADTSEVSVFLKWIAPRWRRFGTALLWACWTRLISLLATDLEGAFSPLCSLYLCISFRSCWHLKRINAVPVKKDSGFRGWHLHPFLLLAVRQANTSLWLVLTVV